MPDGRVNMLLSIIIRSPQPDRLAHFYRDVLGLPLAPFERGTIRQEHACQLGDVHFAIELGDAAVVSHQTSLTFAVGNLTACIERLAAHGLKPLDGPTPFGENSSKIDLVDPDDNPVVVVELAYEWIQFLEERRSKGLDSVERWKAANFR
jgi:catechol 2,3-dioxygenase-like lactoylglutathione lyase family enzyme